MVGQPTRLCWWYIEHPLKKNWFRWLILLGVASWRGYHSSYLKHLMPVDFNKAMKLVSMSGVPKQQPLQPLSFSEEKKQNSLSTGWSIEMKCLSRAASKKHTSILQEATVSGMLGNRSCRRCITAASFRMIGNVCTSSSYSWNKGSSSSRFQGGKRYCQPVRRWAGNIRKGQFWS